MNWETSISMQVLGIAMALLALPLFLDLAVCILGNLRRPGVLRGTTKKDIRLAVVIPARNEECMIARTVRSLLAAGCSAGESAGVNVFVVAHNCTDRTAEMARTAGARVIDLSNPKILGKGAALRCGFKAAADAGANAFLVLDADSVASPNLIAATRMALEAGAEATQCRYELEMPAAGGFAPMARLRVMAFRGINVLRARGRASLGFSAGLFGNGFAVTAATLERVPFNANSICEDIEYHIKLTVAGIHVRWIEEAAVLAPLSAPGSAQANQEARWEGGRFHVATRSVGPLVKATFSGNWRAIEMLIEAWSLPISRGIMTLLLTLALPLHWLHVFALICAVITLLYVMEAALLGPEPWLDLAALAAAPAHIAWKAMITPLVLRQTRKRAEWARTRREAPLP